MRSFWVIQKNNLATDGAPMNPDEEKFNLATDGAQMSTDKGKEADA
jgi:hypothetical protein